MIEQRMPPARRILLGALALAMTGLAGCYSGLGDGARQMGDDGADAGDAGDAGEPDRPPRTPGPEAIDTPFEPPGSEVELLPFHVRLANLAAVAGVHADDPMFMALLDRRFQLGDHDYANGIAPDLKWTPERMETWVKAVRPVCDDPRFQARYPDLATDPSALARAAFARDPSPEELQAFAEVQAGQLDGAGRYRMSCLAVLSSLEFVAR